MWSARDSPNWLSCEMAKQTMLLSLRVLAVTCMRRASNCRDQWWKGIRTEGLCMLRLIQILQGSFNNMAKTKNAWCAQWNCIDTYSHDATELEPSTWSKHVCHPHTIMPTTAKAHMYIYIYMCTHTKRYRHEAYIHIHTHKHTLVHHYLACIMDGWSLPAKCPCKLFCHLFVGQQDN